MTSFATVTDTVCYSVTAAADPGILPRLIGQLARISTVPSRLHMTQQGDEVSIDMQVEGVDPQTADTLEQRFRGMVGVTWVGASRKARVVGERFAV